MMKKALVGLAFSAVAMSAQAGALVKEGFDDVSTLAAKGWVLTNASTPSGLVENWFQGDQSKFRSLSGARESYIAGNYNLAAAGGTLDSWLITPEFSLEQGATLSFWARGEAAAGYSDLLSFAASSGSSALTAFSTAPSFTVATNGWTRYVVSLGKGEGTGRFAIRYTGAADASNYVGIDSLLVAEIPEPSTMAILFAGAMGLMMSRRRKRG